MGKPRAATRQPMIVSSEEDEDDIIQPPAKRPKTRSLTSKTQSNGWGDTKPSKLQQPKSRSPAPPRAQPNPTKIRDTSNRKDSVSTQKSPSKSPAKAKPKYKPITSFFNATTRVQGSQRQRQPTPSPEKIEPATSTPLIEEDHIFDSSADELPDRGPNESTASNTALAVRKRTKQTLGHAVRGISEEPAKGSQKFLRSSNRIHPSPSSSQTSPNDQQDLRPWNEKYGPTQMDELAVHKRKVADVRNWLYDVFGGRERKRLLIMKGPAGSGKTTSISLLSKELNFNVQEWKNPTSSAYSSEGFVSLTAQFEDFVGRSGTFGSLDLDASVTAPQPTSKLNLQSNQNQLVLVEEFPNTFTRSSSSVQSFRSSIENFLAATTPSAGSFFSDQQSLNQPVTPIVMIISEALLSTNTAAADSFTAHRLLGPEILNHPGVSVIEFNSIAPTFMTKALELVVLKEARKTGRRRTPGPQVIKQLSELGDIRNAISSLEFLCIRGDEEEGGWGAKVAFTKSKKTSRDVPLTRMEQDSLEMVTQRESTLGIFHAVGRVVYNKRIAVEPNGSTTPQPPHWFPEHRRSKVSEVNVDTLLDELGTDTQTFVAALHENYILSCEGPTSEDTMDCINGCMDALSDSDLLSTDRFGAGGAGRRTFQGTSADNLRQEELSFQASVRGLLFSLPSTVKRIAPPSGTLNGQGKGIGGSSGGRGAFQMYYPTSLRLWRQREEVEGLLDLWINRAQHGELFASVMATTKPSASRTGGVESWRKNSPFSKTTQEPQQSLPPSEETAEDDPAPVILGSGGSARYEMLLERLPYVSVIIRAQRSRSSISNIVRDVEKITSFTGIGASNDDEPDDEDPTTEQEQWSTDAPNTDAEKRKRVKNRIEAKTSQTSSLPGVVEKEVARLILSDDDIED